MKKILVSSNCQTSGIALALKALLPHDNLLGMLIPSLSDNEKVTEFKSQLKNTDYWVTCYNDERFLDRPNPVNILKIPIVEFHAFQPDITYVTNTTNNNNEKGAGLSDYHSKIIFWCFKNNKSRDFATSAFNKETFSRLGYFSCWNRETEILKSYFEGTDVDFNRFFSAVLSHSPFMHSMNHPTSFPLCQIAKQIAEKIGTSDTLLNSPIERSIQDTLSGGDIWPIYPEVAAQFGFDGSYIWKIWHAQICHSVEEYVNLAYDQYEKYDISILESAGVDATLFANALERQ